MDGGMSNISQILDGMQTLATESASSSFTGDRTVLNNEFQTDISEINRQAQAIGLNTGGTLLKTWRYIWAAARARRRRLSPTVR
jgi:flagellin